MNWLILILAGLCEVGFATCLGFAQQSRGMEAVKWYTAFVVVLTVSMLLLIKAIQTIPIGTAYAVWTGIGAVGTVLVSIFIFKEQINFWKLFFIITLITSVVGLKAVSEH